MLSQEQIQQIKKQLIQQIEANFPEDKKQYAIQQIESMNAEELEEFLMKNQLIANQKGNSKGDESKIESQKCIFCSIVSGNIQSYKIDENKDAIAVLEINPISQGHSLIIPKKHTETKKLPKNLFSFAEKIAKKIKKRLKVKDIKISSAKLFSHEIINILPVYKDENLNSKRIPIKPEELEEIQKILTKTTKIIKKSKTILKIDGKIWLPKRIP